MAYIKADDQREQEYFDFLEDLRSSGDTNMYGASPYLEHAFNLEHDEAVKIVVRWMNGHSDPKKKLGGPLTKTKVTVHTEVVR